MVDARDLKSRICKSVWVQFPPAVKKVSIGRGFETSSPDYDGKIRDRFCVRVTSQAMCVALVAKSKNGDELIL